MTGSPRITEVDAVDDPRLADYVSLRDVQLRTSVEAERGLFLSHGDFYATTAVERLGLSREGLVRIGCACYTTDEEIDRLLDGVRAIVRGAD